MKKQPTFCMYDDGSVGGSQRKRRRDRRGTLVTPMRRNPETERLGLRYGTSQRPTHQLVQWNLR